MPGQGGGFSLNGGDVKDSLRLELNLIQADQQNRRKNRKRSLFCRALKYIIL